MESVGQSGVGAQPGEMEDLAPTRRRGSVPRWVWWMNGSILAAVVAAVGVVAHVIRNAEPILRRRMIATLEARFHSPVELDALHISVVRGLQVSGSGLRILSLNLMGRGRLTGAWPMQRRWFRWMVSNFGPECASCSSRRCG